MNIGDLITSAIDGFFRGLVDNVIAPGVTTMLNWVTSSENMEGLSFFDGLHQGMLVIGIAMLTAITAFALFKSFFSFTGIEAEDPVHIGAQYMISLFLVWYSKDILLFAVNLNSSFIETIVAHGLAAGDGVKVVSKLIVEGMLMMFTTGPLAVTLIAFEIIPVLYILYRVIRLLLRMFQRMVLVTFLVIASPLAFAAGISKATRGFQVGFVRVFAGNLVIQLVQTMCLMALGLYTVSGMWDMSAFMTTIAILYVLDRVEDIVRELSFGIGAGRDTSGGAAAGLSIVSGAINSYQNIASYLPIPKIPRIPGIP